jgi:GMP synthase-like glutamine amidotransferase
MPRMDPVVIVRHAAHEGPGYFADFLDAKRIPHRLVRIDAAEPLPQSLAGISGLVFMGGPMSVNDPLPWISPVLDLIQQAVAAGVPVLGHCLGGQLMARALGGRVTRNPVKEIGWLPVHVVDSPVAVEWFGYLPPEFPVFHWHGETFSIPGQATRVLASADCPNQAFVLGPHLALQCHVEMTTPMIAEWTRESDELMPSRTVQTAPDMLRDADRRVRALHHVADRLYERWILGLPRAK